MSTEDFLWQADIVSLQAAYRSGELSASDAVRAYLDRIERLNPRLGAVICTNPAALTEARSRDESGDFSTPLAGIPILIKDNIETRELPTTAGSLALQDNHTGRDAPVVHALRNAGAIILGKANLSEWANFRAEASTSGWSAIGGQCRNPHNLDYSPGGSSSGSGAAVAANLCMGAVGTETLGSIISPAAANGVVGIKPSVGLLSRQFIVPISHNQDTAGPIAKSVDDAMRLLAGMAGREPPVAASASVNWPSIRLGISPFTLGYHPAVDSLFREVTSKLQALGAQLVDGITPAVSFNIVEYFRITALYEFKHNINLYFASLPNDRKQLTLSRLIDFNRDHPEELRHFGQDLFEAAEAKGPLDSPEYLEAAGNLFEPTRQAVDQFFADHQLNVMLAPTMGPIFPIDYEQGDGEAGGHVITALAALTGYPHITVPMGSVDGLPVGISVMGLAGQDFELAHIASALARLIDHERPLPL